MGASSVAQLEQNVATLDNLSLSADELAQIEEVLPDAMEVDLWRGAREGTL
jgi:L-glyceraldehyde 3-phosphate reductase